jgi:hypothetical protein
MKDTLMAKASRKHFGAGAKGKGSGSGGQTEIETPDIGENAVLSNRDKAEHTRRRGLDSKRVQADQLQDSVANRGGD